MVQYSIDVKAILFSTGISYNEVFRLVYDIKNFDCVVMNDDL